MIMFSPSKGNSNNNTMMEEPPYKENFSNENPFSEIKTEKTNSMMSISNFSSNPEDVLATVTNSMKTNIISTDITFKKSNSLNVGPVITFGGTTPSNGTSMQNTSQSAKKENDKKIWRKRI
jgi:GH15 family glucan-1,4-alpha-glucosidase